MTAHYRAGSTDQPDPAAVLTERELNALALIAGGLSNEGIAAGLHVSVKTVESLCGAVFRKLGLVDNALLNRRVQAAATTVTNDPAMAQVGLTVKRRQPPGVRSAPTRARRIRVDGIANGGSMSIGATPSSNSALAMSYSPR